MSLSEQINDQLKQAMKAKDQSTLRGLRAIKASLLLLQTQEGGGDVTEKDEMEALVKMAKQRKDSIQIFNADYEINESEGVIVEQVIRPTGLLDPIIEVKPCSNQVDDLLVLIFTMR